MRIIRAQDRNGHRKSELTRWGFMGFVSGSDFGQTVSHLEGESRISARCHSGMTRAGEA
jgi:hypothetical protein